MEKKSELDPKDQHCKVTIINPLIENFQEMQCRICLDSDGQLLKVCNCSGSIEFVHLKCIKTWINTFSVRDRNHSFCELCNTKYQLSINIKEKKYYKKIGICLLCSISTCFFINQISVFIVFKFIIIIKIKFT